MYTLTDDVYTLGADDDMYSLDNDVMGIDASYLDAGWEEGAELGIMDRISGPGIYMDLEDDDPHNIHDFLYSDNPLGTYFNDKLGGVHPVSSSAHSERSTKAHAPLKMVLIFVRETNTPRAINLCDFFAQQKIEYKVTKVDDKLPFLYAEVQIPRYSLIVFEDYTSYVTMDSSKKSRLDKYCRKNYVGIFSTTVSGTDSNNFSEEGLKMHHRVALQGYKLNPQSTIWRVGNPDVEYLQHLPSNEWTVFVCEHRTFRPLVFSTVVAGDDLSRGQWESVIAVHDIGKYFTTVSCIAI